MAARCGKWDASRLAFPALLISASSGAACQAGEQGTLKEEMIS